MTIPIASLAFAILTTFSPGPAEARVDVSVGLSFFYSDLAPYGNWVTVREYGDVWCPRAVAVGWQPYLRGEWRYTDYGWTWVSFDPWGGVPYHYGTWVITPEWGWVWIPGTTWAPAWVTWCFHGDTIGWAPVPPSFSLGLAGYGGPAIVAPARSYVFVPMRSFVGVDARTVRLDPARNTRYVSGAQKATSFAVSGGIVRTGGPAVSRLRTVTGAPIRTSSLSEARTRAIPVTSSASTSRRSLAVVAPARERATAWHEHQSRGGKTTAQNRNEPERRRSAGDTGVRMPAPKKKVEPAHLQSPARASGGTSPAVVRSVERQYDVKRQAPAWSGERVHEAKPQAPARSAERVHEVKPQLSAQPARRPHEVKPQAPARPPEPPRQMKAQAPQRPAPPPHEKKASRPAKKPEKPEPHGN